MKLDVGFSCASANLPALNSRDGMSAIALYFHTILIGVRDDIFLSGCHNAMKISSMDAGIDVEVLPLYVHATADVLSQNIPMCLKVKSFMTYSSKIHPSNIPTNSRLFIVNPPFEFV